MSANRSTSQDRPLILAIDDDALDRALIEHVLTKNGYAVQTAETAEIALRIMKVNCRQKKVTTPEVSRNCA